MRGCLRTNLTVLVMIAVVLTIPPVAPAVASTNVDTEAQKLAYSVGLDKAVAVVLYKDQYGTGWFVNKYYLVTAAHVVAYTEGAQVQVVHGKYRTEGIVTNVDRTHDVAVIRVNEPWPDAKILSIATDVSKGMQIMVIGYPFELYQLTGSIDEMSINPRASFGHVNWVDTSKNIFEIGARTDAGNSGGPIIEVNNNAVVGLVSFALHGEVATLYYGTSCVAIAKDLAAWNIPFHAVKVGQAATPQPTGMNYYRPNRATIVMAAAGGVVALLIGVVIGMSVRRGKK